MSLDPHLREIIVCPQCRGSLTDRSTHESAAGVITELLCEACSLAYPIVDDIPVLLVDEARPTT
jgi:uncharacterized protein